ncbi:hypothetical protein NDU88_000269 [Pleurodeles waltl]|uniref:Uncharacterized protein n=1 Tax=Pleurodeles waltl TaxID=8319 RepID=A0AAV7V4M5_PLEWA|nr:hypothetical protein NDU88_000269 [Pleurodeles waltl]
MASFSSQKELQDRYFDARTMMMQFTAEGSDFLKDTIDDLFPLLNKTFSVGDIKGEVLIQMSIGIYFPYILPACEPFRDIYVGGSTDKCITELEKWRKNAPDAVDFSYAAKVAYKEQSNRECWTEKQNMLRMKMKPGLKYDVNNTNPFHPTVLPPADCLFLIHCLECHTTDEEGFCRALKHASFLLKKGGHLLMIACLGETFYMVGDFKWNHLSMEAEFVKKALCDAGYEIKELHVLPRAVRCRYEMGDYHSFLLTVALKKRDV